MDALNDTLVGAPLGSPPNEEAREWSRFQWQGPVQAGPLFLYSKPCDSPERSFRDGLRKLLQTTIAELEMVAAHAGRNCRDCRDAFRCSEGTTHSVSLARMPPNAIPRATTTSKFTSSGCSMSGSSATAQADTPTMVRDITLNPNQRPIKAGMPRPPTSFRPLFGDDFLRSRLFETPFASTIPTVLIFL
jgi:hypothetical protein